MSRQLSAMDRCLDRLETALRTCTPGVTQARGHIPGHELADTPMGPDERHHAAGLMRVNHTGEVCAQALYDGQSATAKLDRVRAQMAEAALEEKDHLAWCEARLRELGSRPSILNPVFYGLSFAMGAAAGALGDRYSLGFVAATEDQVSQHLQRHLKALPEVDLRSQAIVRQMLADEQRHAEHARDAGGLAFPKPVRAGMTLLSTVMTTSTYRL